VQLLSLAVKLVIRIKCQRALQLCIYWNRSESGDTSAPKCEITRMFLGYSLVSVVKWRCSAKAHLYTVNYGVKT